MFFYVWIYFTHFSWMSYFHHVSALSKSTAFSWRLWITGVWEINQCASANGPQETTCDTFKSHAKQLLSIEITNKCITRFETRMRWFVEIKRCTQFSPSCHIRHNLTTRRAENSGHRTGRSLCGRRNVDHVVPNWIKKSPDSVITLEQKWSSKWSLPAALRLLRASCCL